MKFNIKRVGKINDSSFSIAPLTIFIGKNDSGKTYAASTLWALVDYIKEDLRLEADLEDAIYEFINKAIELAIVENKVSKNLEKNFIEKIRAAVQQNINDNASKILRQNFKFSGFSDSELCFISGQKFEIKLDMEIVPHIYQDKDLGPSQSKIPLNYSVNFILRAESNEIGIEKTYYLPPVRLEMIREGTLHSLITTFVRRFIIGFSYWGQLWDTLDGITYIPAARTGMMLGLNYFIEGAISENKSKTDESLLYGNESSGNFTKPLSSFADHVRRSLLGVGETLPGDLLSKLVTGKFKVVENNNIAYQPEGVSSLIPLGASSSLVTELAALSVLGRSFRGGSLIIFEEPEAHLHLGAQQEIAKVIVKLINSGSNLLITTHSDTFLQQINNLILLNDHPNKESLLDEFNLSMEETLSKEKVAAYDFQCLDGVTNIVPLEFREFGFVADSLNDVLINLAKQTRKIISSRDES